MALYHDPGRHSRWFFDLKEFKPQPGFEFEFTVEHQGMTYRHLCKVTEVVPQKKIAYTWRYDGHKGDSLVTYELFAEGNRTRLKLTHDGLETFPKTPSFARKNFERGWNFISAALKDFVDNLFESHVSDLSCEPPANDANENIEEGLNAHCSITTVAQRAGI